MKTRTSTSTTTSARKVARQMRRVLRVSKERALTRADLELLVALAIEAGIDSAASPK